MRNVRPRVVASAVCVVLCGLTVFTAASVRASLAAFTSSASNGSNALATDTLVPPTGLTADGGNSIVLNWTATVRTYATGYHVLRGTADGGPYTQIAVVTPRTNVTFTDGPPPGTYYYVVRAYYENWESADSSQDHATTP